MQAISNTYESQFSSPPCPTIAPTAGQRDVDRCAPGARTTSAEKAKPTARMGDDLLRIYLYQMGSIPRLTCEEINSVAQQIERARRNNSQSGQP